MRGLLVIAMIVALGACGSGEAATTTSAVASPTTTTVPPTTSTTVTTTTTVPVTTTSSVVAEGVPEEALSLIGAPMPEVPEFPDGFDAERWFEAYVAWNQWAFANPTEGLESLDQWVVPGSDYSVSLREQLQRQVDEGWRSVGTDEVELREFEVADEFESEGFVFIDVVTASSGQLWIIDDGQSVVAKESLDGRDPREATLSLEEVGVRWLLGAWD